MKVKYNGDIYNVTAFGAVHLDGPPSWTNFDDVEIVSDLTDKELDELANGAWECSDPGTDCLTFTIAYIQGYKECLKQLNKGKEVANELW
jgi:hypothetical protein